MLGHFDETELRPVGDINIPAIYFNRLKTGCDLVDELFGQGALPGSVGIIHGVAGAGKTTLLLQISELFAKNGYETGYCTGEEAEHQAAYTCQRIGVRSAKLANITNVEKICKDVIPREDFVIIDSIASLKSDDPKINAMSPTNRGVKLIEDFIIPAAQRWETVVIVVLHITKSGQYKGSTAIKHAADFHIEMTIPDPDEPMMKKVSTEKNRFGSPMAMIVPMYGDGFDLAASCRSTPASETDSKIGKAQGKSARKNKEIKQILALASKEGGTTAMEVMREVELTKLRADFLLSHMKADGHIIKEGRGKDATFSVPQVADENKQLTE